MSMFTQRHYAALAADIESTADDTFYDVSPDVAFGAAYRMAYRFTHDNSNFDIDRFMRASGFGREWRRVFDSEIDRLDKEEGFKW